jgi:hypothetical protein
VILNRISAYFPFILRPQAIGTNRSKILSHMSKEKHYATGNYHYDASYHYNDLDGQDPAQHAQRLVKSEARAMGSSKRGGGGII